MSLISGPETPKEIDRRERFAVSVPLSPDITGGRFDASPRA